MHTSCHTKSEQPTYLLKRGGAYYYNRRTPSHAVKDYGPQIRIMLSRNKPEALKKSLHLTAQLDTSWNSVDYRGKVDVRVLLRVDEPQPETLVDWAEEYLSVKTIDRTPTEVAARAFMVATGRKDVRECARSDVRKFVGYVEARGNSTGTIRRRLGSLSAVINYAFAEMEVDRRNPFKSYLIRGEGRDRKARLAFTGEEVLRAYRVALKSARDVRLLVPLVGETGCRLGEVVGLRVEDVDLQEETINVVPHATRRLKTKGSERELPLVGAGLAAMKVLVADRTEGHLLERYVKAGEVKATHASNALNKWLKAEFDGKTAHCLRHAFRDRLRAVECPLEMIDALGGWSSIGTVGVRYGRGYDIEHKRRWLNKIALRV